MATTPTALPLRRHRFRLADPDTYRQTLHLLADLPIGTITFTLVAAILGLPGQLLFSTDAIPPAAAVATLAVAAVPLLLAALQVARWTRRVETTRARVLLNLSTTSAPVPAAHGIRARLGHRSDWRGLAYAVVLLPVGILTSTVTLTVWAMALGAITFPLYAWTLADPAVHIARLTIAGPAAHVGAVLAGIALLLLTPTLIAETARLDRALVRGLLH